LQIANNNDKNDKNDNDDDDEDDDDDDDDGDDDNDDDDDDGDNNTHTNDNNNSNKNNVLSSPCQISALLQVPQCRMSSNRLDLSRNTGVRQLLLTSSENTAKTFQMSTWRGHVTQLKIANKCLVHRLAKHSTMT
jgi:hypothetical protein